MRPKAGTGGRERERGRELNGPLLNKTLMAAGQGRHVPYDLSFKASALSECHPLVDRNKGKEENAFELTSSSSTMKWIPTTLLALLLPFLLQDAAAIQSHVIFSFVPFFNRLLRFVHSIRIKPTVRRIIRRETD